MVTKIVFVNWLNLKEICRVVPSLSLSVIQDGGYIAPLDEM